MRVYCNAFCLFVPLILMISFVLPGPLPELQVTDPYGVQSEVDMVGTSLKDCNSAD